MKSLLAREEVRIFAAPAYLFAISNFLITNIDTIKIWITKAGLGKVEELLEEMLYCIEELSVKSEKEINNFFTIDKTICPHCNNKMIWMGKIDRRARSPSKYKKSIIS